MHTHPLRWGLRIAVLTAWVTAGHAVAATENGNDMCLYLSEAIDAGNAGEVKQLEEDAEGVNYYFRYLEIFDMQSGRDNGLPYVDILAREPSSYFKIRFRVTKKTSLTTLMQEPQSKIGDAVAVLGRPAGIDDKAKVIVLDPVIVKHKDHLTPKLGKELLGEVDSTARYYSYTAVAGKPVEVSYADRDLIENNRGRIPEFEASPAEKEAWADFLLREVAKRDKVRAAALQAAKNRAGIMADNTNAPTLKKAW